MASRLNLPSSLKNWHRSVKQFLNQSPDRQTRLSAESAKTKRSQVFKLCQTLLVLTSYHLWLKEFEEDLKDEIEQPSNTISGKKFQAFTTRGTKGVDPCSIWHLTSSRASECNCIGCLVALIGAMAHKHGGAERAADESRQNRFGTIYTSRWSFYDAKDRQEVRKKGRKAGRQ